MTNTALFIYYTPSWQRLADVVLPVAQAYCDKWGYALEARCGDECKGFEHKVKVIGGEVGNMHVKQVRPDVVGYHKIRLLRNLMEQYELIWVLDCDALITNSDITLSQVVGHVQNAAFTEDTHGLNAGSWIATNSSTCKLFIDMVITGFDAPEEQTVMKRYLPLLLPYNIIGHPSINSYLYTEYLYDWDSKVGAPMPNHAGGFWQPGDLCLHLPGVAFERRIEVFEMIKEQIYGNT